VTSSRKRPTNHKNIFPGIRIDIFFRKIKTDLKKGESAYQQTKWTLRITLHSVVFLESILALRTERKIFFSQNKVLAWISRINLM